MPGDVLSTKSGTTWFVVDEFVSVLRSGEERIGLRVVIDRGGRRKVAYVGTSYLRRMLAQAAVVKRSRRTTFKLKEAPRVPHVEDHKVLDAAFRGRPIGRLINGP